MTTINYENEISKLKQLKKMIRNLPDNKMKMMLIYNYDTLVKYLIDLNVLDTDFVNQSIPNEFIDYSRKMDNIPPRKYNAAFYDNSDLIYEIIRNNNEIYKKYPIVLENSNIDDYKQISLKEMFKLLDEFFVSLGSDVYNIYKKIVNNNLITSKDITQKYFGCTYDTSFSDYPHVILASCNNLYQLAETIVHEIGHCYDLVRNKTNNNLYRYNILSEVSSILFQKMFDLFLYDSGYYRNAAVNNLLLWKSLIVSMNLGCSLIPDTSFYGNEHKLDEVSEIDVILECLLKMDEGIEKAMQFYPVLFQNYNYILGDVIANNLLSLYRQDPKNGLKEIKNFIATIHQYTTKEHLQKYASDMTETEEEMKKLYKFQKRKFYL